MQLKELINNKNSYQHILLLLLLAEVSSYFIISINSELASVIMCLSGMGLGYLIMHANNFKEEDRSCSKFKWWYLIIGGLMMNWLLNAFVNHHESYPIGLYFADMLPMIKVQCERFIEGKEVYSIIPEIYNQYPVYLPAMWLPFSIPLYFHQDMRWANVVALLLSLFIFYVLISRKNNMTILQSVILLFIAAIFTQMLISYTFIFAMQGEESVVVFYYSLLVFSLYIRNPYLTGISIAFCILSRYSLMFWLIAVIVFLIQKRTYYPLLIKTGISCFITLFALLLFTHSLDNLIYFTEIPDKYFSLLSTRIDSKEFISEKQKFWGLLAITLGVFSYSISTKLFFILNVIVPALIFYFNRKLLFDIESQHWMLMGSLKIAVLLFLYLNICPYSYLFFPSLMLSMIAVAAVLNE